MKKLHCYDLSCVSMSMFDEENKVLNSTQNHPHCLAVYKFSILSFTSLNTVSIQCNQLSDITFTTNNNKYNIQMSGTDFLNIKLQELLQSEELF